MANRRKPEPVPGPGNLGAPLPGRDPSSPSASEPASPATPVDTVTAAALDAAVQAGIDQIATLATTLEPAMRPGPASKRGGSRLGRDRENYMPLLAELLAAHPDLEPAADPAKYARQVANTRALRAVSNAVHAVATRVDGSVAASVRADWAIGRRIYKVALVRAETDEEIANTIAPLVASFQNGARQKSSPRRVATVSERASAAQRRADVAQRRADATKRAATLGEAAAQAAAEARLAHTIPTAPATPTPTPVPPTPR